MRQLIVSAEEGPRPKLPYIGLIEITRSFSYKLNCGNYESRDFFCSQKARVAPEDAESASDALHSFCKRQVMQAVAEYQVSQQAAAQVRRVS